MDPPNLDALRMRVEDLPPRRPKTSPPRPSKAWFLKGPIPGDWLRIALGQPLSALKAGLVLWYLAGLTKSREVKPTGKDWARFGIHRQVGARGLQSLESVGLISVDRRSGRCPIVTIHDVEDE